MKNETPRKIIIYSRDELKQFEVQKTVAVKKQSEKAHARRIIPAELKDPIQALSTITQSFLASMDITTAEDFLSSRTTDIANEFVKFRILKGMPELKGLGAIASVSGWKAQCRKVAKKMGMNDVARLEPESNIKREVVEEIVPRTRKVAVVPKTKPSFLPSRPDVLQGQASRTFRVQSREGEQLYNHRNID